MSYFQYNGKKNLGKKSSTDDFLYSYWSKVISLALGRLKSFGRLTGKPVNLERQNSVRRAKILESGIGFLKSNLDHLEIGLTKMRARFVLGLSKLHKKQQAYWDEITLVDPEQLTEALPEDKAMRKVKMIPIHDSLEYKSAVAILNASPRSVDTSDFADSPEMDRYFRQLVVSCFRLALAELQDRLTYKAIKFRTFEPLPEVQIPDLYKPVRTNILVYFTLTNLIVFKVMVVLALIPEYFILHGFALNVLKMDHPFLFPLFLGLFGVGLGFGFKPTVLRFLRSSPKWPRSYILIFILVPVLMMCFGYSNLTMVKDKTTYDRIEKLEERVEKIRFSIEKEEVPNIEEAFAEIKKTEQDIEKLDESLLGDTWFANIIQIISVSCASAVIITYSGLLTAILFIG
jgi:hypothetical protein